LTAIRNVPKAHVQGFELSAEWQPIQGLTIAPTVSMADTQIDKFTDYNTFGIQEGKTPGTRGDPEQFRVDAYTLLDLRLGVEHGAWRFQIWGRNVTDEYYWKSVYYSNDEIANYAGMPATYGSSVSWRSGE
jgi:outer membrane receptor protein involved in Fe transport